MITNWKLFNFKSVQKETELPFAPLTIFAGANSSGKSTIIQSILLIGQTLSHKIGSRSVVLNGALTQLGQFDDLKSVDSDADQITIGWECTPKDEELSGMWEGPFGPRVFYGPGPNQLQSVSCEISFDADPSSPERDLFQLQPRLFSSQLSSLARTEDKVDLRSAISISRSVGIADGPQEKIRNLLTRGVAEDTARASLDFDVDLDEQSLAELRSEWASAEMVGCFLRHFLPDRLAVRINAVEERAQAIHSALLGLRGVRPRRGGIPSSRSALGSHVMHALRSILGEKLDWVLQAKPAQQTLFPDWADDQLSVKGWVDRMRVLRPSQIEEIRSALEDNEELISAIREEIKELRHDDIEFDLVPTRTPGELATATRYLDYFFSNRVKYLGPLRDEPKALYPLAASADPSDVGLRGELTAAVLDLHKSRRVRYMPASAFTQSVVERKSLTRTLESAVTDWLQYLGVAETAISRDRGKLGHELKVALTAGGPEHDLTHVGVGVSQVLPILVACLLADPDTTLIFEQPELHLHPRVQTRLADFFLSIVLMGKQCIIETHSEYLINRLRFRAAAEHAENRVTNNLRIYFVEKPNAYSEFREVRMNEYGAIHDWPEGFFDQSQREAEYILRAAMKKKQQERRKGKDSE